MDVVCFGELLIDFVADESGKSVGDVSKFVKAPGGAPANVAVGIARLGHQSAFIGQVGADPFGQYLSGILESENVNVEGLSFSPEARTALAFVSLADEGERSFVFYRHPSADMLFKPEDVNLDIIESTKIFHFGSITLIHEPSKSATIAALDHARKHNLLISYDPNLRMALWSDADSARREMMTGFDYAHIVKISDEELEFLTGGTNVGPLWREPTKLIVVTHGSGGATAHTRHARIHRPAPKANAIDTTGAGDAFVAGLLTGILENPTDYQNKLEQILHFANTAGSLATTKKGAIPALPQRQQVEAGG
jgi:fructokinase